MNFVRVLIWSATLVAPAVLASDDRCGAATVDLGFVEDRFLVWADKLLGHRKSVANRTIVVRFKMGSPLRYLFDLSSTYSCLRPLVKPSVSLECPICFSLSFPAKKTSPGVGDKLKHIGHRRKSLRRTKRQAEKHIGHRSR